MSAALALATDARTARLEAALDLLSRGATMADVDMIQALAERARGFSFTSREMGLAAALRPELAAVIEAALGPDWSIKRLGKRLLKLRGAVVNRDGGNDRDGLTWSIRWPRV